ncbi:condensin subunit Smc [Microlunatus sagamiharensis]|uniref:Chromosome partition protein Smc n=1 Tax=Microlunatus sagamiharensis TaxID=546874 RepID=A0A1H2LVL2_9ACTN|nr:chromosome segregation protein SMC [Microlunatus sagamiharensis]SDU84728.1 condensin subunit Smc [Microlunatus sagamiharensis]
MYLKNLTLRGFKSFASATSLTFEPGITCVVGPNGSGKSNVVDALAWVMGEQGAKSLRGGKMEDVIFAGTAGRAPLGRAEVALTIDNTDGALPLEYTEVTISRTMFRNGGSEYAINGRPARLLDVQELLSDSGIGREMHVIVGQGQLDTILQATPEVRRGFVEEAAGVLKHRKRKEKALRKLEACEGNLERLSDLLTEIRRQLKPLGRQAEVARKAAVVQAEARDARARLLADDLVQATLALESEVAGAEALLARRGSLETALAQARESEAAAEERLREATPRLTRAQETWYALAGLRERVTSTISIATERVRHASDQPDEVRTGRDPEALEREAEAVAAQEADLLAEVARRSAALAEATAARAAAEEAHRAEEQRYAALVRAAADRREGLVRLHGQVEALRSRGEAADAELERLATARGEAERRAEEATLAFTALESRIAGLDDGELGLDSQYEEAAAALEAVEVRRRELREAETAAAQERAALAARVDALGLGLQRKDAAAALLAEGSTVTGLLGSLSTLLRVEPGLETAVAAALGTLADAVAVEGLDTAFAAVDHLKTEDLGRAGLLVVGAPTPIRSEDRDGADVLPDGSRWATDVVQAPEPLRPALARALHLVAVVEDLAAARSFVQARPEVTAVTRAGDVVAAHLVSGGSSAQPSLLEAQAALDEAGERLAAAEHTLERLRFTRAGVEDEHRDAAEAVEVALARLHESDAVMSALAEELGQRSAQARGSSAEAGRLGQAIEQARGTHAEDAARLVALQERLAAAEEPTGDEEPDPAQRDALGERARLARAGEMDARLALRTQEERARALSGRADTLRRAARAERDSRAKAHARRERMQREARTAAAVRLGAEHLLVLVDHSLARAAVQRTEVEAVRADADATLRDLRGRVRALAAELETLVNEAHRDEMARTEQRLRVENLVEKAAAELALDPEVLVAEFGPDQLVPVLTRADGTALPAPEELAEGEELPAPRPYVREEQATRLRKAERALSVLGRVNPLALEEFDAMEERHRFLAEQLEDLRRTRKDLVDIIADVDARVQQVFAEAYADVEVAFARVFSRLFPGGEGRLVLTEPGDWLTTGIDVEARPAGKKVKRLSLLSGGERSLVAVAFLVSLFIARPSPFYILDEVEAALDDTNLGRLLDIYTELRASSQLLVITHQKRTMEVADALYGVTMRGDGVSAVISQRLREAEAVA